MYSRQKEAYLKQIAGAGGEIPAGGLVFNPEAVLIDMDGVLFDSMPIHCDCWCRVMENHGFRFDPKDVYIHEGRTGKGTLEIVFRRDLNRDPRDEEVEAIYGEKCVLFDEQPEAPTMKGARRLLDTLRDSGQKRVLVTGSGQRKLLGRLNHHFPGHFTPETMVTAFDVTLGKPYPEPYLIGLKKAGVPPTHAVVVENAPLGVQAGKAAGLFTIAVNTGLLEDHYLLDAGCDLLFHSLDELADAWPDILKPYSL